MAKYFFKSFTAIIVAFTILFGSVAYSFVRPVPVRGAQAAEILKVVGYLSSILGLVNIGTGGGVTSIGGSIKDGLQSLVADAFTDGGIYTNSNGEYVFSNSFTSSVYEFLKGNNNPVKVVSNFTPPADYTGYAGSGSSYTSPTFKSNLSIARSRFSSYLSVIQVSWDNYSRTYEFWVYDFSDVSLISIQNGGWDTYCYFYDHTLHQKTCPYYYSKCVYRADGFTDYEVTEGSSYNFKMNDGAHQEQAFIDFPYYYRWEYFSNRSLLVSIGLNNGNEFLSQESGTFFSNTFNQFPSVSQDVINNNNWDNIYNNYVTNVANSYYEDTGGSATSPAPFDQEKLRKWMKQYSNVITDAVESGVDNIADQINYVNEWLNKIYNRLGMIYDLLDNWDTVNGGSGDGGSGDGGSGGGGSGGDDSSGGSSGGGCLWTDQDIFHIIYSVDLIKDEITTMDTSVGNIYLQLGQQYTLLQNILTALQSIQTSKDPQQTYNQYQEWFDYLDNLPDTDITQFISTASVLESALESVAPFCFVLVAGDILSGLSHNPVQPEFNIPFRMVNSNTGFTFNQDVNIDLTIFNDLRNIVTAFLTILFIIGLIWLTFWLMSHVLFLLGV